MSKKSSPTFSVVTAVYNEELNIEELYKRLVETFETKLSTSSFEIIFVDDGSRDNSWNIISKLSKTDKRARGLKFSRNFGHHLALTAGLDYAEGDSVVIMDSDLQDRPEEIANLYAKMQEGYDVVYGIRKKRQFGFFKTASSKFVMSIFNRLTESHLEFESNIFRIMSRRVVDHVICYREQSRFLLGIISLVGFKRVGVEVEHGKRFQGESKYNLKRLINLGMHMLTSFSYAPLRVAMYTGFATAFVSIIALMVILYQKFIVGGLITGWSSIMTAIFFIGSVQLISLGIMGEYIGRIFTEVRGRPLYIVEELLNKDIGEEHESIHHRSQRIYRQRPSF